MNGGTREISTARVADANLYRKQSASAMAAKQLWIVPSVTVLILLIFLSIGRTKLSQSGIELLALLIYSILIGPLSAVLCTWIGHRYTARFPHLVILFYALALVSAATAGTFAAGFVLEWIGIVPRGGYWREFWGSWLFAMVITLMVGLTISMFETMRSRLQEATLELRTRQMEQERANKLMAEARLSSLESRIHPHFLFNTLNSIASLIPSDPKRAEDTVAKLAALLRFSLNANHSSLVPLAQELKIVRDFLEIESTRFGPRLHYHIAVPESLGTFKVPPLALQTLAENCVKHVVAQRTEGAEIQILGTMNNGRIHLEVIDDGPGFSLADISPEHGLGNLSARLELLFAERGSLDVDRQNERTIVRITIPAEA